MCVCIVIMYKRKVTLKHCLGAEPLDVRSLSTLLATIFNWESLGIRLGLQMHQLEKIRHDCQGDLEMCKNRLYDCWLRQNTNPTWRQVVEALEQMEENNLADKIKHLFWQDFIDSKHLHIRISFILCGWIKVP